MDVTVDLPVLGVDHPSVGAGKVNAALAALVAAFATLSKTDVGLANVPNVDATARANQTGTQLASTIFDLTEVVQDMVAAMLQAGSGMTVAYNDTLGTITLSAGAGSSLGIQALQTASFTAAAGNFYPTDSTSAAVNVQLPTSPADGTQIGVGVVGFGAGHPVTINRGGSNVLEGGAQSLALTAVDTRIVLQYKASGTTWYKVSYTPVASSGGGGGTVVDTSLSSLIFQDSPAALAVFKAGLRVPVATVITGVTCVAVGAPAGTATVIKWFKRGPSTGGALWGTAGLVTDPTTATPFATTTFSVPVGGGAASTIVTVTGLAILMQQFDSLVPIVTTAGTTVPTDITAFLTLDPNAPVPTPNAAPTAVAASIPGTDNTAVVTWTAPAVTAGHTPVHYLITSSNGDSTTQSYGTNNVTMTGLAHTLMHFNVFLITSLAGTQITGLGSADSNAVTPTTSVTSRITAREAQGQDFAWFTGPGTVAYDASTTLSFTGSMTTTNTSTAVTGTGFTAGMTGLHVAGTGIPAGATFTYLSSTTGTLSAAATASGTITATYSGGSGVTGSLKITATGGGSIEFEQSIPKAMTAGEGPKAIGWLIKNGSGSSQVFGSTVSCLDGSAFYKETSTPNPGQQTIAASTTTTYSTSESTTNTQVTQGKLYTQVIANTAGDTFWCIPIRWDS